MRNTHMACLMDKHWQYHLDLLMVKHLAWIKASYLDLVLVKCLYLQLDLIMELSSNLNLWYFYNKVFSVFY